MSPFDRAHTTSYSNASVLYHFRDIAGYLSKVDDFDPVHLHLAPPGDVWLQKTRIPGLSCGVVCVILRLAIFKTPTCDRQTDTDTGPWLVPQMHSITQ